MAGVTFGGLASGIDTDGVIGAIMYQDRAPIRAAEATKKDYAARTSALDSLKSKLSDVKTKITVLKQTTSLEPRTAENPIDKEVTVEVADGAPLGNHTIKVSQLATRETEISTAKASKTATGIGTGSFTLQVSTVTTTITVAVGEDTLEKLRDKINDSHMDCYATVIDNGSTSTPYQLMVYAKDGGALQTITLNFTGLTGGTGISMTQTITGQNAKATIDGVPMQNSTNQITKFFPATTINLHKIATAGVTFTTSIDKDAAAKRMSDFVSAYNSFFDYADKETQPEGSLEDEVIARSALVGLRNKLATQGSAGGINTISSFGLKTDSSGRLALTDSTFKSVLAKDPAALTDFVSGEDGLVEGFLAVLDELVKPVTGSIVSRVTALGVRQTELSKEIADLEERLKHREESLRLKFGAMEQTLLKLQQQGQSMGLSK